MDVIGRILAFFRSFPSLKKDTTRRDPDPDGCLCGQPDIYELVKKKGSEGKDSEEIHEKIGQEILQDLARADSAGVNRHGSSYAT